MQGIHSLTSTKRHSKLFYLSSNEVLINSWPICVGPWVNRVLKPLGVTIPLSVSQFSFHRVIISLSTPTQQGYMSRIVIMRYSKNILSYPVPVDTFPRRGFQGDTVLLALSWTFSTRCEFQWTWTEEGKGRHLEYANFILGLCTIFWSKYAYGINISY